MPNFHSVALAAMDFRHMSDAAALNCRYTLAAAAVPDDSSAARQPPAFANPAEAAIRYLLCFRNRRGLAARAVRDSLAADSPAH